MHISLPGPDNEAIRKTRDEIKKLNRSNVILIIITIFLVVLTAVLVWQDLK